MGWEVEADHLVQSPEGPQFPHFPALFMDKPLSSLGRGKGWGRGQVPRWHEAGHVPGLRQCLRHVRHLGVSL